MGKKKTTIKVLDMDEYLGSSLSNPGRAGKDDDLDAVLRDATKMKVNRIKMMEIDKYLLQSEQELEKLKRGESLTSTMGPMASNANFMKMARLMSDLSPEEQKKVANAYAALRMADKGQLGGSLQYLAPLLGYAKSNPGASEDQMIKYLTLMDSQFRKGMEIARVMNPGQSDDSLTKAVGVFRDVFPLIQPFISNNRQNQGFFDQVFTNPETFARMQGLFGGGSSTAKNQFDLDIERLRGERVMDGRKWDLEMKKMALESEDRRSRNDTIMQALGPLSAIIAGPVSQRMQQLGEQQGTSHIRQNPGHQIPTNTTPAPPANTTILIQCTCGHEGPMTFTGAPPSVIKCPQCDQDLLVGGPPPAK